MDIESGDPAVLGKSGIYNLEDLSFPSRRDLEFQIDLHAVFGLGRRLQAGGWRWRIFGDVRYAGNHSVARSARFDPL